MQALSLDLKNNLTDQETWRAAWLHALPVTASVIYLFYYWFAVADRYIVFLYYHNMRPRIPDTSPFGDVTSSRYWMAGLVASGMVMVTYTATSWLLGRLVARYRPPAWWQVWTWCAVPLLVGIPAITMSVNRPTLPALNAAQTTLVTLIGLALALMPGRLAAECPRTLIWLACDGSAPALVLLRGPWYFPLVKVGWSPDAARLVTPWISFVVGMVWLLLMTVLRVWRRTPIPGAAAVLASGLCLAYPLMILVHHVVGTDGYWYVSNSSNFFEDDARQIALWLAAAVMAMSITGLRKRLAARRVNAQAKAN